MDRLLHLLREGPRHLLVLDGLEAVQSQGGGGHAFGELEDPALRRLLRAVVGGLGRSRVLCTSRFSLTDLAPWEGQGLRTTPLPDLKEDEALALLKAYGLKGGTGALRGLLDRLGCHALSVAMAGSYAGTFLGGDPGAISALRHALGDLETAAREEPLARRLRGVLSAYAGALTAPERDLLCCLAVLPRGAPLDLLRAVTGPAGVLHVGGETDLLRRLRRLARLGLVSPGPPYTLHPFVRDHFRGLLPVPAAQFHEAARRQIAPDLAGRPGRHPEEPDLLDRYEVLLEHTLLSGHAEDAWQLYSRALGGFTHLGLRLGDMVRGARILRLLAAETDHPGGPALSTASAARLAYERGLFESALGDLRLAQWCYEQHLAHATGLPAPWADLALSMGKRTLAYNTWLLGELPHAAALVSEALEAAQRQDDRPHMLRALALGGALAHDQGDLEEADRCFTQVRRLEGGPPQARRGLWEAEHLVACDRLAEAEGLLLQDLLGCEGRGWAGLAAHGHVLLGELALRRGDPGAAAEHLKRAHNWTLRSGEVEMTLRCHGLAARLALQRGQAEAALREARDGLALARPCRFRLFTIGLLNLQAEAVLGAGDLSAAAEYAGEAYGAAASPECGYSWGRMKARRLLELARCDG